ncbi:MAG TPA: enoyl-CoA hydratase-related protein [Flavobacteriaceae bacterium]|nr:enoyl-CoA hydratase-related protein [Flavobacteriaceae bacterium]|tara:strand:+ start:2188 stop:2964 length:777 start_codon:yes stop_codon:yes gene_type:complete
MSYNNIFLETFNQIAKVVINRPKKLNSLNIETIAELHQAISIADRDNNIRVIIITGAGEKAFVAGADISEFSNFTANQGYDLSLNGHQKLFDFIENLSKPVIAAINGFALGGGLELAMSCHIRIASENAKMGLPEVSLGVIPGYGGTQRLPQLIGKGKAMELILTGGMIDANNALSLGLVNKVVSQENLMEASNEIAVKILKNSSLAIKASIAVINSNYKDGIDGYEVERREFGNCFQSEDFVEGTKAFLEKRRPNFN